MSMSDKKRGEIWRCRIKTRGGPEDKLYTKWHKVAEKPPEAGGHGTGRNETMRKWIALALALVMLLALAACGSSGGNGTEKESGTEVSDRPEETAAEETAAEETAAEETAVPAPEKAEKRVLRVGCDQTGGGFNPASDNQCQICNYLVYDRCFDRGSDGQYIPCACESYEWLDSLTLQLHVRDGVYFSDGDQLTGEDILYTFRSAATSSIQSSYYDSVDYDASTVSDDGLTVTFVFKQEFGPFESLLDNPHIMNRSAVEFLASDEPSWWDQPIGSGPYEVVENIAGSHTTFRLREDYWNKDSIPPWDEITVNFYSEPTAMFIAFESGELDFICNAASGDVSRLISGEIQNAGHAAYELVSNNNVMCLNLSANKAELQDPKVREAIAHIIDTEGLGQVVLGPLAGSPDSVLSSTTSYYYSVGAYEYDPDYARQCMAESAYPDGFELKAVTVSNERYEKTMEVLQGCLEEIGIRLSFQSQDVAACIGAWMTPGSTDIALMEVLTGNSMREPFACLSLTVDSGAFSDFRVYDPDREYAGLFEKATYSTDPAVRAENYELLQQWLHDSFQCIPLMEDMACVAWNSDKVASVDLCSANSPNLLHITAAD